MTSWARISPEEVSKEIFEAIVAKDPKRVEALLPTDEELKSLGLPAAEIEKVQAADGRCWTKSWCRLLRRWA